MPGPIALALLDQPLDYILADHMRQRSVCAVLRELQLQDAVSRNEANQIVAFLQNDLPLHHADEDVDLFPALHRRALPEDDLAAVLLRLVEDHRQGMELAETIIAGLSPNNEQPMLALSLRLRRSFEAYAAREHRHLAIENAVVMVIARVRLQRRDLRAISDSMKRRRGITAS